MSNQVYSNQTQKYFTYPGFNNYTLNVDQNIPSPGDVIAAFADASVMQPTIISHNAGVFSVLETGIYSIRLNLGIVPSPATSEFGFDAELLVVTTDARNLTPLIEIQEYVPAAATFAQTRLYNGSYTGWLHAGDTLQLDIANLGNVALTLVSASTSMIFARIY